MVMGRGCQFDVEAAKWRLSQGYSRSAPLYDALAGHLYLSNIRRLLPRLSLPPTPAILDVGCGTGINLLEAARWFSPTRLLCGIDISPGMVEVARRKASALGLNALFTVGDAEHLPYPNDTFDLVISNSVLHWFGDRQAAVREMGRVLRPGGKVILICAAAPGFQEWFSLVDGLLRTIRGPGAHRSMPPLPTAAEVVRLMLNAGFVGEYLANPVQIQQVSDPEPFVRLMSTVAPGWAADLSAEDQGLVERMAVGLIRRGWPQGFRSTWAAIEAIGTKATL